MLASGNAHRVARRKVVGQCEREPVLGVAYDSGRIAVTPMWVDAVVDRMVPIDEHTVAIGSDAGLFGNLPNRRVVERFVNRIDAAGDRLPMVCTIRAFEQQHAEVLGVNDDQH